MTSLEAVLGDRSFRPHFHESCVLRLATSLLLLTAYCLLHTQNAWAVCPDGAGDECFYVNDCCRSNDIYTSNTGNDTFGGGACATPQNPATPARSLQHLFDTCPIAVGDRVFVDVGYYPSRDTNTFDCPCDGPGGTACQTNACDLSPDLSSAPFTDGGAGDNQAFLFAGPDDNFTIIGPPFHMTGVPAANEIIGAVISSTAPEGGGNYGDAMNLDGRTSVRIMNLVFRNTSGDGLVLVDCTSVYVEGCLAAAVDDEGFEDDTGGVNNVFRYCAAVDGTAASLRRGFDITGANGTALLNVSVYRADSDGIRIAEDGGGVDASNIDVYNSVIEVNSADIGIRIETTGGTATFDSDYNFFSRQAVSSNVGRWRGNNAATVCDWVDYTGDNDNGDCGVGPGPANVAANCNGTACPGGSDDLNSFEPFTIGPPIASDVNQAGNVFASTGGGSEDVHIRSFWGRFSPALEQFTPGDDDHWASASNTFVIDGGRPADAFIAELESNGAARNMGAFGNTFHASRSGKGIGITYDVGTMDTDPVTGGVQTTLVAGRRFASGNGVVIQVDNNGDSVIRLNKNSTFTLSMHNGTSVVTATAYLTNVGSATPPKIIQGEANVQLRFEFFNPIPSSMCGGTLLNPPRTYAPIVTLRGDYIPRVRFDPDFADRDVLLQLDQFIVNNNTTPQTNTVQWDGRIPMPDFILTGLESVLVTGRACTNTTVGPARAVTASTDLAPTDAQAAVDGLATDGDGAAFTLTARNLGNTDVTIPVFDGACGANDTFLLLTDADLQTYRACYRPGAATTITSAGGTLAMTLSGDADIPAAAFCNGEATATLTVTDSAANVYTPVVLSPVNVRDANNTGCNFSRIVYVEDSRAPAGITGGGGNDSLDLTIVNIGTTAGQIDDNPANSWSSITLSDGVNATLDFTLACRDAGGGDADCNGATININNDSDFGLVETFSRPPSDLSTSVCNGPALMTLNVRGLEPVEAPNTNCPNDVGCINQNPAAGNSVTYAGGATCLSYIAQSLQKLDAVVDDASADGNVDVQASELGVQFQVDLENLSGAVYGPLAAAADLRFRVCCDATCTCGTDYTANCQSIGGTAPCTAVGATIAAGARATVVFAAVAGAFGPLAGTYDGTAPLWAFIDYNVAGGNDEPILDDQITVTPVSQGIGDKVSESGWIEIER